MIIIRNDPELLDILKIREVWVRGEKVWPEDNDSDDEIESCFARGYWIPEYPWTSSLGWKNNA